MNANEYEWWQCKTRIVADLGNAREQESADSLRNKEYFSHHKLMLNGIKRNSDYRKNNNIHVMMKFVSHQDFPPKNQFRERHMRKDFVIIYRYIYTSLCIYTCLYARLCLYVYVCVCRTEY